MVSTSTTCGQVSPPNAPAFIANAPPKVPGIPAKNSAGPRFHLEHCLASLAQGTPASHHTSLSLKRCKSLNAPCVSITAARKPPSRTNTLLPSPNQNTGIVLSSVFKNSARSGLLAGLKNTSAGPPTRHEVCLAKGSL